MWKTTRALYKVVTTGVVGETYNIGGHNEKQNLEVVHTICDLLDEMVPKAGSYREQITYVADRPGHDRRYAIDASKMSSELHGSRKKLSNLAFAKLCSGIWITNSGSTTSRAVPTNPGLSRITGSVPDAYSAVWQKRSGRLGAAACTGAARAHHCR